MLDIGMRQMPLSDSGLISMTTVIYVTFELVLLRSLIARFL